MLVAVGRRRGGGGDGASVVELGGSCWSGGGGPATSPCADAECLLDALNDGFGFFQVYYPNSLCLQVGDQYDAW